MKKWLTACLLAIALLFVASSAMAGHNRTNGDNCIGQTFQLVETTETQHTLYCTLCKETFTEDHWVGQEATCMQEAQCGSCPRSFGKLGAHGWSEWKANGRGTHTHTCKYNSAHVETKDCTFDVAPCTELAACTECGTSYILGHNWGGWVPNGDKTHTRTCTRDASHTETKDCSIREASCSSPARCQDCRGEYGSADPTKHKWLFCTSNGDGTHTLFCSYDMGHTEIRDCSGVRCGETGWCNDCYERYTASHKFSGSWSTNPDKHWRTCIYCNEAGSRVPHSFVEQPDAMYLKSEATCVSPAVYYRVCADCGYQTPSTFESGDIAPNNHDLKRHDDAKAPTCTEKGWNVYDTCSRCNYSTYQELPALNHAWGDWISNGNLTHTRSCKNDPGHTETEACSGVRCGETGSCSVCNGEYTVSHRFDGSWSSDADKHWRSCIYCRAEGEKISHSFSEYVSDQYLKAKATCVSPAEYYRVCADCGYQGSTFQNGGVDPDNHGLIHHAGKAATCTETGWKNYDTCSRCDYTTYAELPALGHDPTHHAAQTPTCTETGWKAYDTCSRCDYTTYAELPALGHDPTHHAAQTPTCTETGWKNYDTCSRCDYTTYAELPALGHAYQDKTFPRSCTKDGYTLHTCSRCAYSYRDEILPHDGHEYGEWTTSVSGTHAAACRRSDCYDKKTVACESIALPSLNVSLCPICGTVSDGAYLVLTGASVKTLSGRTPYGEPLLRLGMLQSGEQLLSVGFEYGGRLTQPAGQVEITLPAALLDGCTLMLLEADGAEAALSYTLSGDEAIFTLDFSTGENRALVLRLAPVS